MVLYLHPHSTSRNTFNEGALAQLVEQRTENPCVPGSIPGGTTFKNRNNLTSRQLRFFCFLQLTTQSSTL
jgi:hypothetical protein